MMMSIPDAICLLSAFSGISDESMTMDFDYVNQVYVRSGETFTVIGSA